tara:strand:+ start:915 stop:1985 length:1071 start_codon:yes stop_codon:yes gene_type:complete
MAFFNKKEEVIDIQLTQYGKSLLSKGMFKPVSYAFFDDNVLYDSSYAGLDTEHQNDIEPRIQENTPALKTQHIFYGAETEIKRIAEEARKRGKIPGLAGSVPPVQPIADKHYALSLPLGTSALHTTNLPAWQIRFFGSELEDSIQYSTGSHPTTKIPQLNSVVTYKTEVLDATDTKTMQSLAQRNINEEYTMTSGLFSDSTFFQTIGDQLLIEIDEKNTDFFKDNFTIEVFEVMEEDVTGSIKTPSLAKSTKKEVLRPLSFRKKQSNVKNDILVGYDKSETTPESPDDASYYFDVRVDAEIPPETLCAVYQRLRRAGDELGYLSELDLDCPDIAPTPFDLYATNVTEEDIEKCLDD